MPFFNSFKLVGFTYQPPQLFTDTSLHYTVQTPVKPALDTFIQRLVYEAMGEILCPRRQWLTAPTGVKIKRLFFNTILPVRQSWSNAPFFPITTTSTDTATFWENQINLQQFQAYGVKKKEPFVLPDSAIGYKLVVGDTNTVRQSLAGLCLRKIICTSLRH